MIEKDVHDKPLSPTCTSTHIREHGYTIHEHPNTHLTLKQNAYRLVCVHISVEGLSSAFLVLQVHRWKEASVF